MPENSQPKMVRSPLNISILKHTISGEIQLRLEMNDLNCLIHAPFGEELLKILQHGKAIPADTAENDNEKAG